MAQAALYWKVRLLANALEEIALSENLKPGITPVVKKELLELLARPIFTRLSEIYETSPPVEITEPKTQSILNKWVKVVVKKLCEDMVDIYKEILKNSGKDSEKKLLQDLTTTDSKPIDLIFSHLASQIQVDMDLDLEIKNWTQTRDQEMDLCKAEVKEFNDAVMNLKGGDGFSEFLHAKKRYADFLREETSYLQKKQRLENMRQTIAENPPYVQAGLHNSLQLLEERCDKLRAMVSNLKESKSKYDALGSQFVQLLSEWNEYGRQIEQKEWILQKMKQPESSEDSFTITNDLMSFITPEK